MWQWWFKSPTEEATGMTVASMLAEINARHGARVMGWVYRRFPVKSLRSRISERQANMLLDLAAQAEQLIQAMEASRNEVRVAAPRFASAEGAARRRWSTPRQETA